MMDNEEILQKMHSLHLMLADELKRICEAHNIKYFMIAGTLLGAVRHKGFIPWDDDMDFGMMREDFEKFLAVAEADLDSDKIYLQSERNTEYYAFNYAKLRLKNTSVIEEYSSAVDIDKGIYIDIFPMDAVADNKLQSFLQYKGFWYYKNLLWIKCKYGTDDRKQEFSYKVAKALSSLYSIGYLKKRKHQIITRYCGKPTKKVVTSDGGYGLTKETLEASFVQKVCDYPFEDRVYPGMADYDGYLSYFYGDYMQLPPEEQRNHHARLDVDFGPYANE